MSHKHSLCIGTAKESLRDPVFGKRARRLEHLHPELKTTSSREQYNAMLTEMIQNQNGAIGQSVPKIPGGGI